jgi:elongation factor 1-beta
MVMFATLKNDIEIKSLSDHLATVSYIEGWTPTGADAAAFSLLKSAPSKHAHALRWYNHMNSFKADERAKWGKAGSSAAADDEEEEEIDLFGDSDEEEEDSEEKQRIKAERLAAYAQKKSAKPGVTAKSSIIFDVKPWDDECDLAEMERKVREIEMDGLIWGPGKLIPVAFGIKKLQIGCVVEDLKVSIDMLEELICGFEDHVQSVDIAAFNKI